MKAVSVAKPDGVLPCGTKATGRKAKTSSTIKEVIDVLSRSGGCHKVILPTEANWPHVLDEIRRRSPTTLRDIFPGEFTSHKNMLSRMRQRTRRVQEDLLSFKGFLIAVLPVIGLRPPGYTLDRVNDADAEYAAHKLRWATPAQQAANRRGNHKASRKGQEVPVCTLAARHGLKPATVRKRIARGASPDEALSLSLGSRRARLKTSEDTSLASVASKARHEVRSLDPLWQAWAETWRETFPHAPGPMRWTKKERGQLRAVANRFPGDNRDPVEFLRFVVRRWRQVCCRDLRGLTMPEFPSVGFLANHRRTLSFFDAYATEQQLEKVNKLDRQDRDYAMLLRTGWTEREAEREMRERDWRRAVEEQHAAAIAHMTLQVRLANLARDEARRDLAAFPRPPAPSLDQPFFIVDRPPMDHGVNAYEHPERMPDLTELADLKWED